MLLNLADYAEEVEAFAALADDFIDATSALRLNDVARELRNFVDAGTHNFTWQTHADIVFRKSNNYDGPGRVHNDTNLEVGFTCEFSRPANTARRCRVWRILRSATHIALSKDGGQLRCHIDYKNPGQWGPQVHFQINEAAENGNLPIPRIPSLAFLPTDCADLALSELHPEEWKKVQASGAMSRHMSLVRSSQERRSLAYIADIRRKWDEDRQMTRISMLQDYTANVGGFLDSHGNEARI